ncbi:septal ring lytic transglycosylase RlpA family protein [bacterium]|nr:septal ring lytic transglycosylase RlpA family protein [bacterium]
MKSKKEKKKKLIKLKNSFLIIVTACSACAPNPMYQSKRSAENGNIVQTRSADVLEVKTGVASFYADKFDGRKTSNGEIFDQDKLTAAHRTYPFGTVVRVTNLSNKQSVVVRINDRGPFVKNRLIDLSKSAAKSIGMIASGTANVRVEVLSWGQ